MTKNIIMIISTYNVVFVYHAGYHLDTVSVKTKNLESHAEIHGVSYTFNEKEVMMTWSSLAPSLDEKPWYILIFQLKPSKKFVFEFLHLFDYYYTQFIPHSIHYYTTNVIGGSKVPEGCTRSRRSQTG